MYNNVLTALSGARTIKEHITKLQAILDKKPTDPQLAGAISAALTDLMPSQAQAAVRKVSGQKVRLNNTTVNTVNQLYAYCQRNAVSGTPEWMVAAQNAGWTPPTPKQ